MRILFLTHYFPPEGNAPASRVHEMCKRWVRDGHEVQVITCAPNHPDGVVYEGYRNRFIQRELTDGIEVTRVWTYLAANQGTYGRIASYISYMLSSTLAALFAKRFDIVIATSPQFFCGWAGVLVRAFRRRPFILEIRDIWPESIVAVGAMSNRRVLRMLEKLELWMYAAATHIVTVGDGYRRQLLAKHVTDDRLSVITNGVDRDRFVPQPPDLALKAKHGLGDAFVCAYVGTIGMASGLEVVLEAGKRLQAKGRLDIRFLLVGEGAVRKDLQMQARSAGLDNVIFTGRQPKELMPAFLSIADACLVHLRKTDLFASVLPSKIFEAAAMARPIVLGVEGDAADLVQQAGAGMCIEPENVEQLIETVEALADDPSRGVAMGQAGHDYVTTHYDRDILARRYLDVIEDVLARSRDYGHQAVQKPPTTVSRTDVCEES